MCDCIWGFLLCICLFTAMVFFSFGVVVFCVLLCRNLFYIQSRPCEFLTFQIPSPMFSTTCELFHIITCQTNSHLKNYFELQTSFFLQKSCKSNTYKYKSLYILYSLILIFCSIFFSLHTHTSIIIFLNNHLQISFRQHVSSLLVILVCVS